MAGKGITIEMPFLNFGGVNSPGAQSKNPRHLDVQKTLAFSDGVLMKTLRDSGCNHTDAAKLLNIYQSNRAVAMAATFDLKRQVATQLAIKGVD